MTEIMAKLVGVFGDRSSMLKQTQCRAASASAAILIAVLVTGAAASEFRTLDADALKTAVDCKTVHLHTAVGSIPITFKSDGTMIGRSADLANYLGRSYDSGTWWIVDSQLCQKWKMWLDGKQFCFTLRQAGQKVQWTRNDGVKGSLSVSN